MSTDDAPLNTYLQNKINMNDYPTELDDNAFENGCVAYGLLKPTSKRFL